MHLSKFTGSIDNLSSSIIRRGEKSFCSIPSTRSNLKMCTRWRFLAHLLLLCRFVGISVQQEQGFRFQNSPARGSTAFSSSCFSQPWTWMTLPPTMGQWWSWWHPSSISLAVTTSSSRPGGLPPGVQLLELVSVSSSLLFLTDGWMQFPLWFNFTWGEGSLASNPTLFCLAHAEVLQNFAKHAYPIVRKHWFLSVWFRCLRKIITSQEIELVSETHISSFHGHSWCSPGDFVCLPETTGIWPHVVCHVRSLPVGLQGCLWHCRLGLSMPDISSQSS